MSIKGVGYLISIIINLNTIITFDVKLGLLLSAKQTCMS